MRYLIFVFALAFGLGFALPAMAGGYVTAISAYRRAPVNADSRLDAIALK